MGSLHVITKTVSIAILITIISGCARSTAWRTELEEDCSDRGGKDCIIEESKEANGEYTLGFLEFTERGNLYNTKARDKILGQIQEDAKSEEGVLVIVFAHGWNHNASFDDKNVQSFKEALEKIPSIPEIRIKRKVYGVYLGWRGLVWPNSSLNSLLTYWDRKSVAQEIGKGGVSDILLRLDLITQPNPNNTLLVTGHSFGGAVLLSAINEILLHQMLVKKYAAKEELRYFADGVVLLNPAVEANQMLQTFEIAREISEEERDMPEEHKGGDSLITIISSEGDRANKVLFPFGQFFNTMFFKHEKIDRDYSPERLSERKLDITTVGHYKPFHTGNLIDIKTIRENSFLEKYFTDIAKRKEKERRNEELLDSVNLASSLHAEEKNRSYVSADRFNMNVAIRSVNPGVGAMLWSPPSESLLEITHPSISPETGTNLKGWGYVDCCQDPQACILSNEDSNVLCKEPLPLSLVYTEKSFIGDHNDVFNNNVLAYLAAGATGTMFKKKENDGFDFSTYFKYFYGELEKRTKCEEKSAK